MYTHTAPDEQAPPSLTALNSTSILLTWLPPEAPNGVILGYNIYRDGNLTANTMETTYIDTDLTPNTRYSYVIEAINTVGTTTSVAVAQQTLEGVPTGITPPTLQAIGSMVVQATWEVPAVTNGMIVRYELVIVAVSGVPTEDVVFSGLELSTNVSRLLPFTVYSFELRACTSGRCGFSDPSQVQTGEAPPTFQPAPNVTMVSSTSLQVSWDPPAEPNGVVSHYVIYQRSEPFEGEGVAVGNVTSSVLSFLVEGLCPFTSYEFRVVSFTTGGGTASGWSLGKTAASGIVSLYSLEP